MIDNRIIAESNRRFDRYLQRINAGHMKKMVRAYGGRTSLPKQDAIIYFKNALEDPEKVRKAIASLEPLERFGLHLVKQMGGTVSVMTLGMGLLASGIQPPKKTRTEEIGPKIASSLSIKGFLLRGDENRVGQTYTNSSYNRGVILYTDPRIMAEVDDALPAVTPLPLVQATPPTTALIRMPSNVVLELIAFLQTMETMGQLSATQKGTLRVSDVNKFRKAMKWPKSDFDIDGFRFNEAAKGFLYALSYSDFAQRKHKETMQVLLNTSVDDVTNLSYPQQVTTLMHGFLRIVEWNEVGRARGYNTEDTHQQLRVALYIALLSIPTGKQDNLVDDGRGPFYTFASLEESLYQKMGHHFSVNGRRREEFYRYRRETAITEERDREYRSQWEDEERVCLTRAFTSWLYYLGLVELGMDGNELVAFRLTALGKAVLHPQSASAQSMFATPTHTDDEAESASKIWVVQPNMELIVYMERVGATQLAFLERHAQRTQSQQYTAHYQLTRESVYRGLEHGTAVTDLLNTLANHAQSPLPQNVIVEIEEWAALREQLVLHHRTNLLEFETSVARDDALSTRLSGKPVGDRFLLLKPRKSKITQFPDAIGPAERINYTQELPPSFSANAQGVLTLSETASDLLTAGQLDKWAEKIGDRQWQLTQTRVSEHMRVGNRISELFALFTNRCTDELPPNLKLALGNWAGEITTAYAQMGAYFVVECGDMAEDLLSDGRLKNYLRKKGWHGQLFFDAAHETEIREILAWMGISNVD